jgi:hypothetical protein
MICFNASKGKNIKAIYLNPDKNLCNIARTEIDHLEKLGILPIGSIAVQEDNGGKIKWPEQYKPCVAVIVAENMDKFKQFKRLKDSGVETINTLNTQGLSEIMYQKADVSQLSAKIPLRGIAIPSHVEETLPESKEIGLIKPSSDENKKFWVTPLFFSTHKWKHFFDIRTINPSDFPSQLKSTKIVSATSENCLDLTSISGESNGQYSNAIKQIQPKNGFIAQGKHRSKPYKITPNINTINV